MPSSLPPAWLRIRLTSPGMWSRTSESVMSRGSPWKKGIFSLCNKQGVRHKYDIDSCQPLSNEDEDDEGSTNDDASTTNDDESDDSSSSNDEVDVAYLLSEPIRKEES